ncbi:uncharacterized protein LOC111864713 [Cryptotermes secundus]|uniref:uncharacterized protein LOC111864713 n=1 Tax=Cryptotermes secundus TaxID=105785 RepID=UPI000CD7B2A3|nr:uncharacterized protein LOC111864713 [Cryptotermes secundus]XP_023707967.1 uncharacterized protein LOC111864713 [Cryptotermes secundus]
MKKSVSLSWNLTMRNCYSFGLPVIMAITILMVLTACPSAISAEETGTNFFLKASKSVPRIGRRSEYDNFFLKASKSVPRIGRRREMAPLTEGRDLVSWPWPRGADIVPGLSRRSNYYLHEEAQPLSWNSVEKTMEERPELWKPDLWSKNSEPFPLKDEYDLESVVRRSPGRSDSAKDIEEARSRAEV